MSWFAGIVCAVVVGGLVWFAIPMVPVVADVTGELFRSMAR